MTILSQTDPTAEVACTLPVDGRLRIRIERTGPADLDAEVMASPTA